MRWLITKNPVRLALLILLWNLIIGVIVGIIQAVLKIDPGTNSIAGIVAVYIVGSGYALQYHEEMSKELRYQVSGISCLIQYVLAFVAYFIMDLGIPLIYWLLIITVVTVLLYFLTAWILGFAGRMVVKRSSKK
jgi:flagellar biosynthesis protein FliQ